jgi:DNA polymerase alpha subunit A
MADGYLRQRKNKAGKFAELRRAREGGGRIWKQEDDTDLYDEVSEDQYKSIVKGRLAKDDFVVDDGIDGYMDNGMDDWGADDEEAVHSDEELPKSKSNCNLIFIFDF